MTSAESDALTSPNTVMANQYRHGTASRRFAYASVRKSSIDRGSGGCGTVSFWSLLFMLVVVVVVAAAAAAVDGDGDGKGVVVVLVGCRQFGFV